MSNQRTLVAITGVSRGIGEALARYLLRMGCDVHGCSRTPPPESLIDAGLNWTCCDVRNDTRVHTWLQTVRRVKIPDALVCNAGVNYLEKWGKLNLISVEDVWRTNVMGTIHTIENYVQMARASLPATRRIVVVGSVAADIPMRHTVAYNISKAALDMLVRQGAREFGPEFTIVQVKPGRVIETAMSDYVDKRVREIRGWPQEQVESYQLSTIPLGRYIRMDEVVETLAWAALDAPAAATGTSVTVGGGC